MKQFTTMPIDRTPNADYYPMFNVGVPHKTPEGAKKWAERQAKAGRMGFGTGVVVTEDSIGYTSRGLTKRTILREVAYFPYEGEMPRPKQVGTLPKTPKEPNA